jgi:type IV pilus assembly protein PilC
LRLVVGARLPTMRVVDAAVLRLPLIGELLLKAQCVRFARTLGTLTSGGVAILDALEITRTTAGSARVAAAIQQIHDRVKGGHAIAPSIEATTIFPPLVASMVEVGEQTGQLADMLNRIAEIYEDDVDRTAASLTALVEPMLIFALAIVVGTIVIALFLPIVRMVQLLS